MKLIEVQTGREAQAFIEVACRLYKNDPNWIRPLDKDILDVFNPEANKAFRFGTATRWILLNDRQEPIGRIAAFVYKKYKNKGDQGPVGGFGFFDCINDSQAANLLFSTAENWLHNQGMEAMDGPINFGERDKWWGLVTKGFEPPLYGMNYNPPYYAELFQSYGFKPYYHQICFGLDPLRPLMPKILERHQQYLKQPEFEVRHLQKSKLEQYALDFVTVYNKAWAGHGGLKELTKEQAIILFKKMKPVMDERIIWFAYYQQEPIALFVNLPDLNQWFKYLNGQFSLFHKLYFLWIKATKKNRKFTGLVFGVVPEWQGKGIDGFIIGESARLFIQTPASPYRSYEMQWIGDFNPKMINIAEGLGETYHSRELTTFRLFFDRNHPFERHPFLS